MNTLYILLFLAVCVWLSFGCGLSGKCGECGECGECEQYEPRQMGSRRYWGFGRENAYGYLDHHEEHGRCYPASQTEHSGCLSGYRLHQNMFTGRPECCVNVSNY